MDEGWPPSRTVRAEPVMGTVITVDVREAGDWAGAIDSLFRWFDEVDSLFSTFKAGSEVSRLARGELTEGRCQPQVREVLALCEEVTRRSQGAFDIRADGSLDPSGLVKGWSVERAAAMLQAEGARNFFIGAGGDIAARGGPAPGQPWRVGIRHPEIAGRMAAVLEIGDLAVATSGAYERGQHIVDPRTGRPPSGLLSMTVAGPSLTYADAYATAAYVMGEPGPGWVAGIDGYAALAITADRRTVWTAGMDALRVRDGAAAV
ncbi:MAG TPA: FAD:protein FMN transferase [Candidatus Binatia bacterium]|nr:FAD:protein FMN transferase [Candidatus Binatia bacterium]